MGAPKQKAPATRRWYATGSDVEVRRVIRYPGRVKLWFRYVGGEFDWDAGPVEDVELR